LGWWGRSLNSAIKINQILWTTHLKYINFGSMVSYQDEYKEFANKLTFFKLTKKSGCFSSRGSGRGSILHVGFPLLPVILGLHLWKKKKS
jgi:hypothetical protein